MKSFLVSATKDVGYETIVIAESEEEAFEKANYNPDEFEWKRTDDGHDFTIESNVIEATEFPYEEIRDSHGDYFLSVGAAFATPEKAGQHLLLTAKQFKKYFSTFSILKREKVQPSH